MHTDDINLIIIKLVIKVVHGVILHIIRESVPNTTRGKNT